MRSGAPLSGTVRVSGMTKNAGCKQMAAALLAPGVTTLRNMTPVADLNVMVELLEAIGATVCRDGDVVTVELSPYSLDRGRITYRGRRPERST